MPNENCSRERQVVEEGCNRFCVRSHSVGMGLRAIAEAKSQKIDEDAPPLAKERMVRRPGVP